MPSVLPSLCLLFNALVWGTAWWPFQTMHAAGLAAPLATSMIYALLTAVTLVCWRHSLRALLQHRVLWLLAFTSGLTNVSFNMAASTGDVVRVILLFYMMPAWTVLLAWRFLGERPDVYALLRLLLAFTGMAMVIVPAQASWQTLTANMGLPEALALVGGFGFACSNVTLRRSFHTPSIARMLAMFVGCMTVGLLTAVIGVFSDWLPGIPSPQPIWIACILGMAILVGIGTWALQYGASRMPTSTTSLLLLSEVLFASSSAWLLSATTITPRMVLGGLLIVGGALLAIVQTQRKAIAHA